MGFFFFFFFFHRASLSFRYYQGAGYTLDTDREQEKVWNVICLFIKTRDDGDCNVQVFAAALYY